MTLQLESLDNLLTDRRLQASLGTWRTDLREMVLDRLTKPLLAIGEYEPSAI